MTTFLGIVMFYTSDLNMNHFFVKTMTLANFFGLFHGLLLAPLLCITFGPRVMISSD